MGEEEERGMPKADWLEVGRTFMMQDVACLLRNDAKSFVFLAGPTQEVDQTRRFLRKSSCLVVSKHKEHTQITLFIFDERYIN